jgi:hypothetical protein
MVARAGAVEKPGEVGRREPGLRQERTRTAFADARTVIARLVGGYEQDREFGVALGQRVAHVEAVAVLQTDVEQDGLGGDALGSLQPRGRAVGLGHYRESTVLEQLAGGRTERGMIVDDEDPQGLR